MHEDWEPWVRRLGIAGLVLIGLVLVGLIGNRIWGAMDRVFDTYRQAEAQSDTE